MCTLYTCHKVFVHCSQSCPDRAIRNPCVCESTQATQRPRVQCQSHSVNHEPNFGFIYSLSALGPVQLRASCFHSILPVVCGVDWMGAAADSSFHAAAAAAGVAVMW